MIKPICVLGSLNIDLSIQLSKEIKVGETLRGSGFMIGNGGKGANQASAIAKLGSDVYLVGHVGNDYFGRKLITQLKRFGVHVDYIQKINSIPTGTAIIIIISGNNRIILDAGANETVSIDSVRNAEKLISKCGLIVSQFEIPYNSVCEAFLLARRNKVMTLLNPSPSLQIDDRLYQNTDIIIANEHEASDLTKINVLDLDSAKKAIRWFLGKGIKIPIITLGAAGCVFSDDASIEHFSAETVDAVDTTCAGDSFLGAFAVSLINGEGIRNAIEYATAAAAITVTRRGAQSSLPKADEVKKRLIQIRNKS